MSDFIMPEYNASSPNGGNPLEIDVNLQYTGFQQNYVYQVIMAAFVFMIIPGIGLLYGGMSHRKSALSMIFQSFAVISVVTFQWMFWGYSLTFSRTSNLFWGDLANFGLRNVMAAPSAGSPVLPEIVYCLYQMLFAMCAGAIIIGGAFARGRIVPSLIFVFFWVTLVYCPIASWAWNANGWAYKLGVLDFAGGSPVHMSTGAAGLAYALVLGKRRNHGKEVHRPHNLTMMFLGTTLIFTGWFGFNGGSGLNASIRSMVAVFNTVIGASTGLVGYTVMSYFRHGRKWSVEAACEGVIAGLVGITPAAGFVQPWLAAVIGLLTGLGACSLEGIADHLQIDDGLEVFKLHGLGGAIGSFCTGLFATKSIGALDGLGSIYSGAIDGHGIQVAYQLADIAATLSYSFVVSAILLFILKYTPYMGLRISDEAEERGLDNDQFCDETVGEWDFGLDGMQRTQGREVDAEGSSHNGSEIVQKTDRSEKV